MIETFDELKSELGVLRDEIREKKDSVDVLLAASWVDKLTIIVEKMANSLALLSEQVDALSKKE